MTTLPATDVQETLNRWRAVDARIAAACAAAGRPREAVRLVAVSKTKPIEAVRALWEAGHPTFGENRVQEALQKVDALPEASWHLIGHLQRNKARHVVGRFELIHGVDNVALIDELGRRAAAADLVQRILLQFNLSSEPTKFGAGVDQLPALLDRVRANDALALRGLMTIPPPVRDPEDNRPWFRKLAELRAQAEARWGGPLPELSMGMTDDFPVAIEEGATLIRVGRAIFGERV